MRGENSPADVVIAGLATRQHGVVAKWQLLEIGLGRGGIQHRLDTGRLHVVYAGVYAVGHPRLTLKGKWKAATLACGRDAVLSHGDAAALWGLAPVTGSLSHITSPRRSLVGHPGIRLHRVRALAPDLRGEIEGIPVTTVPRLLVDLAAARDTHPLKRVWEEAQRLERLDVRAVTELCDRSPGRRLRPLRALIASAVDAPNTRRELEGRFADLLQRCDDIPTPAFNVLVEGHTVDAVWLEQKVVVELDSKAYHWTDAAFERDRVRNNELQLAGYTILQITWKRLTKHPEAVADQVRRALAASRG